MANLLNPTPAQSPITGALPWGGGSGASAIYGAAGGDPGAVANAYGSAYNNALAMNQSNYNNILAGYQSTMATQTSAQDAIKSGYSDLYNNVLGKINSIGQARTDAINNASARQQGMQDQQLINRGLGNTTVQASVNRGIEGDKQQALTQLSDDQAKMSGDFMSQLGLAGLGNQQRGLENQTGLAQSQLNWMNSVSAKYPDAGFYSSLAAQAANNRRSTNFGGGVFAPAGGGQSGKLGYVPSPGPDWGSGLGVQDSGGAGGGGYGLPGQVNDMTPGGAYGGMSSGTYGGGSKDTPLAGWDQPYGMQSPDDLATAGAGIGNPYGTDYMSAYGGAAGGASQNTWDGY